MAAVALSSLEGHTDPTTSEPVISVVVPIYNERGTLEVLLTELRTVLDTLGPQWEIVLVDDGSTDGTFAEARRLKAQEGRLVAVRLRRNFGKSAALAAGFAHARGATIITIDADLQDDPAEIPRLVAKLDEGFDLVSGWKRRRCDPWSRRVVSRIFNRVVGWLTGTRLHDLNCGLKAYRREVVNDLRLYGELHRFIPVLAHFRGFQVAEFAVNHRPRAMGRSRYGLERYLRGFLDLLTVLFIGRYRYRPLHLFGGFGLLLGALGFGICLYLTGAKLAGEGIGQRPLLILGVLLIVVGVQFLFMGLLGEMFTSLHEERLHRRRGPARDVDEVL